MKTSMSIVTIIALLLALTGAGDSVNKQSQDNSQAVIPSAPARIALNHNETMMRDTSARQ